MDLDSRGLKRVDRSQRLWCFCYVERNGSNDLEPSTRAKAKAFGIDEQRNFMGEFDQAFLPQVMDSPVPVPVDHRRRKLEAPVDKRSKQMRVGTPMQVVSKFLQSWLGRCLSGLGDSSVGNPLRYSC